MSPDPRGGLLTDLALLRDHVTGQKGPGAIARAIVDVSRALDEERWRDSELTMLAVLWMVIGAYQTNEDDPIVHEARVALHNVSRIRQDWEAWRKRPPGQ